MKIVGDSDIGLVRKENQDAYWFFSPADHVGLAVVCDGMGGANGGQQASTIAIGAIKDYFLQNPLPEHTKAEKVFSKLIQESNHLVYNEASQNPDLTGMGTTLVLALVQNNEVFFANVGDSRGYYITNGSIQQITKDHSAVQELVDSGHLTERQAKIHPNKNVITRALGVDNEVDADFYSVEVVPGDIILICSDGLSNMVDENEIQFEISGGSIDDLPTRLIELANSRGGTDNITVVAIQI